jgi:ABC-2 type transport system permease protein
VLLPRGAEALGAAVAFVVAASVLNGQSALHSVVVLLPVHYWQNWAPLFDRSTPVDLVTGPLAQLATIVLATGIAGLVLRRRDPAAGLPRRARALTHRRDRGLRAA